MSLDSCSADPAVPEASEACLNTPIPEEKKSGKVAVEAHSTGTKQRKPRCSAKRKREEDAELEREEVETKTRTLETAILAAAPSTDKVHEILKGEKDAKTLAIAMTKIAISANAYARETKVRVATLWPSIEKQLQAQMAFSKSLKRGCQKQLKLEVPMVPEEAPRQWAKEYEEKGLIMFNANGNKKLLTDTASQLKFTADVGLGKGIGWGYTSGSLSVTNGLTFTYCKCSRKLVITGKYGLGF